MSDIVCSVCKVPKPPVCFEHSASRHGWNRDVCTSCMSVKNSASARRYKYTEKGKAARQRVRDTQRVQNRTRTPEQYADGIMTYLRRQGCNI